MKFTCAFKTRCKQPAVWCVQQKGVGGATVCEKHKEEAVTYYTHNGKAPSVWRDSYFDHGDQQELDLRFSDSEPNLHGKKTEGD
jgi:hypothetical protein